MITNLLFKLIKELLKDYFIYLTFPSLFPLKPKRLNIFNSFKGSWAEGFSDKKDI
jgi:hypothetical protein